MVQIVSDLARHGVAEGEQLAEVLINLRHMNLVKLNFEVNKRLNLVGYFVALLDVLLRFAPVELFNSQNNLQRSFGKYFVSLCSLILQLNDVLDADGLPLIIQARLQNLQLNKLRVPHSLQELVHRLLWGVLVVTGLLNIQILIPWIIQRILQPIVSQVPLLCNISIFVYCQEEWRDVVVAEPHPAIAKDDSREEINRLRIIVNILEFITVHDGPKHNDAVVKGREAVDKAKLGHAEEGDANDDRDGGDQGSHDYLAGAEHRCWQNIVILRVLEVLEKTEPN